MSQRNKENFNPKRFQGKSITAIENFYNFKSEIEEFRIGQIPNYLIEFDYDINHKSYFDFVNHITKFKSIEETKKNPQYSYLWPQLVDTLHGWIENKSFNYMMSSYWSPRYDKIFVHPGTNRMLISTLFPIKDANLNFIFWNTGGYQQPWMSYMKKTTIEELSKEYQIDSYTLEHNKYIPHIFPKGYYPSANKLAFEFIEEYKKILKSLKIYSNIDLTDYLPKECFVNKVKNANISIKIEDNVYKEQSIFKVLLLIFSKKQFRDFNIDVRILNKY